MILLNNCCLETAPRPACHWQRRHWKPYLVHSCDRKSMQIIRDIGIYIYMQRAAYSQLHKCIYHELTVGDKETVQFTENTNLSFSNMCIYIYVCVCAHIFNINMHQHVYIYIYISISIDTSHKQPKGHCFGHMFLKNEMVRISPILMVL